MSDLITGTIIGGVIGLVSSISTFYIQGFFSQKNTQIQIEARKEEQTRQFENEKDSQEVARLIQVRKIWIEPLTISLKEYSELAIEAKNTLTLLRAFFPEGKPKEPSKISGDFSYHTLREQFNKASRNWFKTAENLLKSKAQISDSQLKSLIDNLVNHAIQVSMVAYTEPSKSDLESAENTLIKTEDKVAAAFKLIEDLLCGKRGKE